MRSPPSLPADVIVPTDVTSGVAAGALAAAFDVSPQGEASYTLPLWSPATKGAISLSLALVYRDGLADGTLGAGWGLQGTSSISRCGKSFVPDGTNREVRFDAGDLFCLDGMQLKMVSGTTYGGDGSVYRTVPDTFVKVTSHLPDGSGPGYFKAYFPDGRIATYGGDPSTRSSRLEGPRFEGKPAAPNAATTTFQSVGTVRLAWALSQTEDRAGNALAYFYTLTNQLGVEQLLSEIRYTFNAKTGTVADAQRKVLFTYEPRIDPSKRYLSGFRMALESRLKQVTLRGPGVNGQPAPLRQYVVTYDSTVPFTQVASVQECDGAGACVQPTAFEWTPEPRRVPIDGPGSTGLRTLLTGDFNGDGCDDLLYFRSATPGILEGWYVAEQQNCGNGFVPLYGSERFLWRSEPDSLRVYDVNADGADDIVVIDTHPVGNYVRGVVDVVLGGIVKMGNGLCGGLSCRASNLFEVAWDPAQFGLDPAVWFADLDGDGLSEFLFAVDVGGVNVIHYKRNFGATVDPSGSVNPLTFSAAVAMDSLGEGGASIGDLNGDGVTDAIYAQYTPGPWIWTGASSFPDAVTLQAQRRESGLMNARVMQRQQYLADLNGDGLVDLIEFPESSGNLTIAYNSGNGFETNTVFTTWTMPANKVQGTYVDNAVRFADINGDGLTEILQMSGPGGRANGAGLSANTVRNGTLDSVGVYFNSTTGPSGLIVSGDQTYLGYSSSQVLDANGDGLNDLVQVEDGKLQLYVSQGKRRHLLTTVTNGMGERVEVYRTPLTDKATVKRTGCSPLGAFTCLTKGQTVVHEVHRTSSVVGQNAITRFSYDTPVFDVAGRRFVSFQKRMVELPGGSGTVTETYDLTRVNRFFPFVAQPSTVTHDVVLGPEKMRRSYTLNVYRMHANADPWWTEQLLSEFSDYEFDPTVVTNPGPPELVRRLTRAWPTYDDFGNALFSTYASNDGWSGTTTLVIPIDTANWFVRNVTSQKRTSVDSTLVSQTRVVEKGYTDGLVTSVTVEPTGDCDTQLRKTYKRNADGLVWQILEEGGAACGLPKRTTEFSFDSAEGITVERMTNAEGHESTFVYHRGLGVLGAFDDANGARTTQQFDGFGRVKRTVPPAGQQVDFEYIRLASGVQVLTLPAGEPSATESFDAVGQLVSAVTRAYGNQGNITARVEYDVLGRPVRQIAPHFDDRVEQVTVVSYDAMGRPAQVLHPDGSNVRLAYARNTVIRTDERGFDKVSVFDSLGKVTSIIEPLVNQSGSQQLSTQYKYGPFRELRQVTDTLGAGRVYERDLRGRVLESTDPYSGAASMRWNPFDELRWHKTAKSELTFERDNLGRLLSRRAGAGAVDVYAWDTAAQGVGGLDYALSHDGVRKSQTYDTNGRLATTSWRFDGEDFTFSYGYDSAGRVRSLQYPTVPGLGDPAVTMSYQNGQLSRADELLSRVAWRAEDYDAEGRLISETVDKIASVRRFDNRGRIRFLSSSRGTGTGPPELIQNLALEFDGAGNVTSRHDNLAVVTEDFRYDSLGRLENWTVFQRCRKSETDFTYDNVGNLLARTPTASSGDCSAQFSVPGRGVYNPNSANLNGAGSGPLLYDIDGRLEEGDGLKLAYDALDRVRSVRDGLHDTEYRYDVDREFVVRDTQVGREVDILGLFRRRSTGRGFEHEYYIAAGARTVAKVTYDGSAQTVQYLLRDAGGSIDVVAQGSGGIETKKYEPFGARRFSHSLASAATPPLSTVREGYVGGYEDTMGLLDLGARLYAPRLHRFTLSDPLVTGGDSSQGWNRTAYAWNNPVSYVDSTGLCRKPMSKYEIVVCGKSDPKATTFNGYGSGEIQPQQSTTVKLPTGSELADSWNQNRSETYKHLAQNLNSNTTLDEHLAYAVLVLSIELGAGTVDQLKLGEGFAEGTVKGVLTDVLRAAAIAGALKSVAPTTARLPQAVSPPPVTPNLRPVSQQITSGSPALVRNAAAKSGATLTGEFSVIGWEGYPAGVAKPTGPFRLVQGAEYDAARAAANKANAALHAADPAKYAGKQIHEIHPVKFGGSPTDLANKIALTPAEHAQYTTFWNRLMRHIQ